MPKWSRQQPSASVDSCVRSVRGAETSGSVTAMRPLALCLLLAFSAPSAFAQGAPPKGPTKPGEPAKIPVDSATPSADSDSLDDEDDKAKPREKVELTPEPPKVVHKTLPPPGDARADEQEPRPVFGEPMERDPDRHLELGPDVGLWARTAKGDDVSYAPGLGYGVHARAELWRFLGLRIYFNNATHAVDVPRGSLGLPDTQLDQPDLRVFQLGARAEPTFMPLPTLRVWCGVGIAWARATAPEPSSTGANQIRYADRSGVFLEYSAALGATWDFIPHWLAATLSVSGGLVGEQSGDLFHEQPVADGAGGTARMAGFPELASSFSAQLGVGMIL